MDPLTVGYLSISAIIVLILCGFHIGIALAGISFVGLWLVSGRLGVAASLLQSTSFHAVAEYSFSVIPLFIVMGLFAAAAGVTRDLFTATELLFRRVRGGVGIATVGANAIYATVTGTSIASAAVFSRLAIPEMYRMQYDRTFALGIVGSSALLGMLIPPSVLMIVYALVTEELIGRLFAAGVVPGLLVAGFLSLTIFLRAWRTPRLVGIDESGAHRPLDVDKGMVLARTVPVLLLVLLVLGGIYVGWFTPTEAGGVGAFGAFVMMVAFRTFERTFKFGEFYDILLETGRTTASILFLLIAAQMYSRLLTLTALPQHMTEFISGAGLPDWGIIVAFIAVLIVLGCLIDPVSNLLLTMPIMVPIAVQLGFDPVHFGIIAIITVELGLLTPPFGMIVFAMKASLGSSVTIEEIYRGVMPFFLMLFIPLALVVMFPQISLWFPSLIHGR